MVVIFTKFSQNMKKKLVKYRKKWDMIITRKRFNLENFASLKEKV